MTRGSVATVLANLESELGCEAEPGSPALSPLGGLSGWKTFSIIYSPGK